MRALRCLKGDKNDYVQTHGVSEQCQYEYVGTLL